MNNRAAPASERLFLIHSGVSNKQLVGDSQSDMKQEIHCILCQHTFGGIFRRDTSDCALSVFEELFSDSNKYYHYLRHYKERKTV